MVDRFNILARTLYRFVASNAFFYVTLNLFVVSVSWIALTSLHPMAFDEEFHLGLIQIYATSWWPYGIEHTRDMAQYGSATGDPSYLFHYLMSFPYRILDWAGLNTETIIIILRFINIAFTVCALFIFRRVIIEAGLRPITANLAIFFYCLIPALLMLAGQINYDNLLLPVVALSLLFTVRLTNNVLTERTLPAKETTLLIITLLFGMSIKYAFLPIALAIGLWVVGLVVWSRLKQKETFSSQSTKFLRDFRRLSHRTKIAIASLAVIGLFFAAHYVTNFVQYGHPIPDCSAVFDKEACKAYGPWNRNTIFVQNLSDSFRPLSFPIYMAQEWFPGMGERLTFAIAGKTNDFQTKKPLAIVWFGFLALTVVGAACLLVQIVTKRKSVRYFIWLTLVITVIYAGVLSIQLYGEYVRTGQPVAINGRYLLLILPLVGAVLINAMIVVFAQVPLVVKLLITCLTVFVLLLGGAGIATYVIQAESHWFWPGIAQDSHAALKIVLQAIVVRWDFP